MRDTFLSPTGRQASHPGVQQLPGSLEKQMLALAAENAELKTEIETLRASLVLEDARTNSFVEKMK